ncbi:MAG: TlpA family protein disulfide reductase [Flavobacteriales bacterium]|nr:TlpA family protein disulfide reductase [Flavobacteriales bacterium]
MSRNLSLCLFVVLMPALACAQRLSGSIPPATDQGPRLAFLLGTRGAEHYPLDSTRVDADGRFSFPARTYPVGFYQFALHDTDRVDIILDGLEKEVILEFSGIPLREHILVRRSMENQLLWEYKAISRANQAKLASLADERRGLAVIDIFGARRLDSLEKAAGMQRMEALERLSALAPQSYFARITAADARLTTAAEQGADAILKAVDLGDPTLLRSAFYARSLGLYLQQMRPRDEAELFEALDALIAASSGNEACRLYTIEFILDVLLMNRADMAFAHVVDVHVAGKGMELPEEIQRRVADQLKVSPGAEAPSVTWPSMTGPPWRSDSLYRSHAFTVLLFYSSTCSHCHELIADLKTKQPALKGHDAQVLGVAVDEDAQDFLKTRSELGIPWPCTSEFKGWAAPSAKAYLVKALPSLYLIDRQGVIVAKPLDAADLMSEMARAAQSLKQR